MQFIYFELIKYKDIPVESITKLTTVEKWAKFFLDADYKEYGFLLLRNNNTYNIELGEE